jgi:O-antigen/teichoic acid export membrane protein
MTSRFRALARDLVVYGLGEIAVKAFGFITLPVYTRFLVPAEYGVYGYLSTIVGLMAAILILGGDSAYARFFFAAKTDEERRSVTSTWIAFLAVWSLAAFLVVVPFSASIATFSFGSPDRAPLVLIAIGAVPIAITNRMCGQILRNQFRPAAFTLLNIGAMGLTVAFAIVGVVVLRLGVSGLFAGALAAELLLLPVRLFVTRDMFTASFSLAVLRQLLGYGVPLVPMSIAYWIFLTSDRVVLARLSNLDEVGLYTVAVTIVAVPSVAIAAVGQAWSPHAIAAYEADIDDARRLVARMGTTILAGFGFLSVAVTVFAPEVLAVLSTPRYAAAAGAVAPLALAMVAQASTNVTALGISLMKRTTYLAVLAWIAAGVNLGLNILLDGPFGMVGAAWATTASYVALTIGYHLVSQWLWRVPYERRQAAVAIVATVAFTLLAPVLPAPGPILAIIIKGLYCIAFVALLLALRVIDPAEVRSAARMAGLGSPAARPGPD